MCDWRRPHSYRGCRGSSDPNNVIWGWFLWLRCAASGRDVLGSHPAWVLMIHSHQMFLIAWRLIWRAPTAFCSQCSRLFGCFTGPGHRVKNVTSFTALCTNSDNSHKTDERQKQYSLATNSVFSSIERSLGESALSLHWLCAQLYNPTSKLSCRCRAVGRPSRHACFSAIGHCCCQSVPAGCVIGHRQARRRGGLVSCVDKECKYTLYSI